MRACGIPESHITGDASDYEKFLAWCQTVPKTIGNPLYTWTHLELKRFFGIDLLVNEENAKTIWEQANKKITGTSFKRREIIKNAKVKVICTTAITNCWQKRNQTLKFCRLFVPIKP
jgi:glucuronate isomerase